MTELFDPPDDAATPLTEAEIQALKLDSISTREELNAAEQENLIRGLFWAGSRKRQVLAESFLKDIHRHMFGEVWRWAGTFRTTQRNIGIDPWEIPVALCNLLEDARTWIGKNTYPADEIAVRFHHRLVQVHPFPNGNGRHARLAADLLVQQLGSGPFSWGGKSLVAPTDLRKCYIATLQAADRNDIRPLLEFARS